MYYFQGEKTEGVRYAKSPTGTVTRWRSLGLLLPEPAFLPWAAGVRTFPDTPSRAK